AAQAGQTPGVGVKEHLVALARIAHQPEGPRRTQLHVRQLHLPSNPAHDEALFAPVELEGFAPGETQGHVGRPRRDRPLVGPPGADAFRDAAIAAGEALRLQLRIELPRGAPLAAGPAHIGRQRLTQPGLVRADLLGARRPPVLHLAADRLPQPALDRVSRQAGPARDLTDRQAVPQPHPADFRIHRHGVHLVIPTGLTPVETLRTPWSIFSEQNRAFLVSFQRAATS